MFPKYVSLWATCVLKKYIEPGYNILRLVSVLENQRSRSKIKTMLETDNEINNTSVPKGADSVCLESMHT